jgi:enamine deaminase RidA (YjgF/YER057c/UK114 family)
MARKRIFSGSVFEEKGGYCRALVDGNWIFVSGTTGYDYARGTISPDVSEQARQTVRNIEHALRQAGGSLEDVVRIRIYVRREEDLDAVTAVMGKIFRDIRPAETLVICTLADRAMLFEMEATALLRPRKRRTAAKTARTARRAPVRSGKR